MAGYIVYNGFWNASPPSPVLQLQEAAEKQGLSLRAVPNTAMTACFGTDIRLLGEEPLPSAEDFVLFWDKDTRLARAIQAVGARVYNPPDGIDRCDDKATTGRILAAAGVPMPKTLVAPMTYHSLGEPIQTFIRQAEQALSYPLVVKECYGSFGGQVYMAADRPALETILAKMEARPFLLQEFIASSAGTDFRLYVVGNRVVAAMQRVSKTDFRANIGQGATGYAYLPTQEEQRLALRCCALLGVYFAGVDLLKDAQGRPLVCEVNSNAFMEEISRCTGVDVAEKILSEVLRREAAYRK